MTLMNFVVGVPAMVLCLVLQVLVVFWCVRFCAIRLGGPLGLHPVLATIRPLIVATLALMASTLVQIAVWGWLFVSLGEFESFYPAIYHSAVNFTSLGYGDVVMNEWKLLGPLEAANGILMMAMAAAALTAILQYVIRSQAGANGAAQPLSRGSAEATTRDEGSGPSA